MPGTHLCLRRWWKADPGCRRLWRYVMQSATEGQVSPPEQVQYGSCHIKETCSLSLWLALFSYHAHSFEKVLSFLPPQSLTLSVLQLVTEERSVMSLHWGYWCHLHSILSSSRLNLSLLLPSLRLALLLQLVQHFPTPGSMIMSALIFKCVCPSVLTPARCQGQAQNGTGIGSQCQGTKHALMACHADFKTFGEPCTWKPESEFKKWQ